MTGTKGRLADGALSQVSLPRIKPGDLVYSDWHGEWFHVLKKDGQLIEAVTLRKRHPREVTSRKVTRVYREMGRHGG